MSRLLLLNGPNINLLGKRETDVYGEFTLQTIEAELTELAQAHGGELDCFQSNHEGELIDRLHQANESGYDGIIFNPAAYTHTSIALRDAIAAINSPVIEVHISNVHKREAFRHQSMLASVCYGQIVGFGKQSYRLAAQAFLEK
ncbi:type II 3-dehydroquinate dehydratase [Lentibacillus sp. CBA3610]|uniref:type II 3-dehydroquinate dehydratase n=1 Tax=Lentibacillus sp. CBA3610 TaxID=2518176 RepID=UPI0015962778|nr:type II 3-dehydroquinate dehydratase [Lentibacillus sp. CBA3610]QKY69309.1 type II 3-dehydroquinate dehydratase [Lentibacillus sp. CBA3610]